MDNIEKLIKGLKKLSDKEFIVTIPIGALKLSFEQMEAVSFVFWVCYLAESDLEKSISRFWKCYSTSFPSVSNFTKLIYKERIFGKRDANLADILATVPKDTASQIQKAIDQDYIPKRDFDIESFGYFSDKIKIFEAHFEDKETAKVLWSINRLRNDISHNRIDKLTYKGDSLLLRETKERLLFDLLRTSHAFRF